jgi:hypothetical protein
MALARIITRFDVCANELSVQLIERGYVVEIVSPDSIPDHAADLELRIDSYSHDQLVATVKAGDGERAPSLKFVHRLKSLLPESAELRKAVYSADAVVNSKSGNTDMNLDIKTDLTEEKCPPMVRPSITFSNDRPQPVRASTPAINPRTTTVEPATFLLAAASALPAETAPVPDLGPRLVLPLRKRRLRGPANFYAGAALTFAAIVLLALALSFGVRHSTNQSVSAKPVVPAKVAAASIGMTALTDSNAAAEISHQKETKNNPAEVTSEAPVAAPANSGKKPDAAAQPFSETNLGVTGDSKVSSAKIASSHSDDFVAHDTVTYLDGRYKPAQNAESAIPARGAPSKHNDAIAANTVTYLDEKPVAKPAK